MPKREELIRAVRTKAEALGVDVSGLTDDEMERQLVDNSKALASTIAAGVGGAAKQAASQVASLREALSQAREKDRP
jgi:predicted methyltransferase MtxX (methanogen marker protein 4)